MAPGKTKYTLYMTPDETERICQTVRNRLQRCLDLRGQPRPVNANRNLAATASFLADISENNTVIEDSDEAPVPTYAVGTAWPPCCTPLAELEPIGLNELCFETRHTGRVLDLRRISPVIKGKVTDWAGVEDPDTGDVEKLEVVLHTTGPGGQRILETGEHFKLKEPLLTVNEDGGVAIRVSHPSDLVIIPQLNYAQKAVATPRTASQYKNTGNVALKAGELWHARAAYAQGLQLVDRDRENALCCDLNRNSAHANLSLSRFDDALNNALAAVTNLEDARSRDLDAKAYFRAARAAYNLRNFEEARAYHQRQHDLAPRDKSATIGLQRCIARLRESETGVYEWQKLRAGLTRSHSCVDAADFTRDTIVKISPGRGNGLFAARDFAPGDLVLVEKAFCVVWAHEAETSWTAMVYDVRDERVRAFPVGLCKAVVSKVGKNPLLMETIDGMYGEYAGLEKGSGAVVDTLRIHDIVARNAFSAGDQFGGETARNASTGLWIYAAKANHCCVPNVEKEFLGDVMVVRAKESIAAGEEILACYDDSPGLEQRRASLDRTWGFVCQCALCQAEETDGVEVRRRRRDLEARAGVFVEKEDAATARRIVIAKAERLAKSVDSTYDEARYQHLPKKALESLQGWLRVARKARR